MPEQGQGLAEVERLLERVERLPPEAQDLAQALVRALLDLYGEGLERIVEVVAEHDDGQLADAFAGDDAIAHLLMLHGLHPVPVHRRVQDALASVTPYLRSHGGSVELIGVHDGVAELRLQGSCSGCPSSAMTLKHAIEEAIFKAAPDIDEVRAEGAVAEGAVAEGALEQGPGQGALLQIGNALPRSAPGPCPVAGLEGT